MSGSEILEGWVNKKVRVQLVGGGAIEGELLRTDAIGGLFELAELSYATPAGPIEAKATEEGEQAYCYIPWTQIRMLIPLSGELP